MLLRTVRVRAQRMWARKMSTFGNNLIERLRTRLVDVQPQNQLGEGAIALGEEFEYQRQCEYGTNGRADCDLPLLCR